MQLDLVNRAVAEVSGCQLLERSVIAASIEQQPASRTFQCESSSLGARLPPDRLVSKGRLAVRHNRGGWIALAGRAVVSRHRGPPPLPGYGDLDHIARVAPLPLRPRRPRPRESDDREIGRDLEVSLQPHQALEAHRGPPRLAGRDLSAEAI